MRRTTSIPLALLAAGLTCLVTAGPAVAAPDEEDTGASTPDAVATAPAAADQVTDGSYLVGASNPSPVLGDLPVQRVFRDRLGQAPSFRAVVTFLDWDPEAVRQFVRSAVPGSALGYWHEPEQEVGSGRMSPSAWADRTADIADIIREEGRVGQVRPVTVLMAWTLEPQSHRGGMLGALLPSRTVEALRAADGVLAWDAYAGPRSGRTPAEMYGPAMAFSSRLGLDWAITETGAKVADPSRWVQTFDWLDGLADKPEYFLAWNPTDRNGGVFAIQQQPAVAAVWRDAIASHSG